MGEIEMRICLRNDHDCTGTLLGDSHFAGRVRVQWDDQGDLADLVDTIARDAIMPVVAAQLIDSLALMREAMNLQIDCAMRDIERVSTPQRLASWDEAKCANYGDDDQLRFEHEAGVQS